MSKSDVWGIVFGVPVMLALSLLWILTLAGIGPWSEPWWGSLAALGLMIAQGLVILKPVTALLNREKKYMLEWVDKK